MEHSWHFLIICTNFWKLRQLRKSIFLGCLSTLFVPYLLFLNGGRLDLIGCLLIFHRCRILQKKSIKFLSKVFVLSRKRFLGCHFVFFDWNIGLQLLCIKETEVIEGSQLQKWVYWVLYLIWTSLTNQIYKFLVPLSCRKNL